MNKRDDWLDRLFGHRGMHKFTNTRCEWCGMFSADWVYRYVSKYGALLCDYGEDDPPKPEREVLL